MRFGWMRDEREIEQEQLLVADDGLRASKSPGTTRVLSSFNFLACNWSASSNPAL